MNRNKLLDCLKGIGCALVVFMHIRFPGIIGEFVHEVGQMAVPVFLLTSGYYAYGASKEKIHSRTTFIFKILFFSVALYFLFALVKHTLEGDFADWIRSIFSISALMKFLVFCTIDFAIPLWYLVAMAETYLLWQFVVVKRLEKTIVKLLPLLFCFQFIITIICESLNADWYLKTNFISSALPFFVLGYHMHDEKIERKINYRNSIELLAIALVGLFLTVIHVIVETGIKVTCIGIALYAIGVFAFVIRKTEYTKNSMISFVGNKLSLDIYVYHTLVGNALGIALQRIGLDNSKLAMWLTPVVVLLITLIFSFVLYKLKERKIIPQWI